MILTRNAPEEIRKIHDRMPLIMPPSTVSHWIRSFADPKKLLEKAVTDLIYEKAE